MTLLAGLAVGVFVYFLVGNLTGYTPEIKIRRFRRRTQISSRQLWLNQAGVEVANTHPYQCRSKNPPAIVRREPVRSQGVTSALQVISPRAHRFSNRGRRHAFEHRWAIRFTQTLRRGGPQCFRRACPDCRNGACVVLAHDRRLWAR